MSRTRSSTFSVDHEEDARARRPTDDDKAFGDLEVGRVDSSRVEEDGHGVGEATPCLRRFVRAFASSHSKSPTRTVDTHRGYHVGSNGLVIDAGLYRSPHARSRTSPMDRWLGRSPSCLTDDRSARVRSRWAECTSALGASGSRSDVEEHAGEAVTRKTSSGQRMTCRNRGCARVLKEDAPLPCARRGARGNSVATARSCSTRSTERSGRRRFRPICVA